MLSIRNLREERREEGEGSRWRRSGGLLIPMGSRDGAAQVRGGGMAPHCGDSEEGDALFAITPLAPILLITEKSRGSLVDLIEALNHFYKIHKNSCGLPLFFRSSTKVWFQKKEL